MGYTQEWYFDNKIPLIQNTGIEKFISSSFDMSICGFTEVDDNVDIGALIFRLEFKPTMPVQLLEEIKVRIRSKTDLLAGSEGIEIALNEWDFVKKSFISYVQGTSKFFEDSTVELMMMNRGIGEYEPIVQEILPVGKIMETWENRLSISNTRDFLADDFVYSDDYTDYLDDDDDFVYSDDYTDFLDPEKLFNGD